MKNINIILLIFTLVFTGCASQNMWNSPFIDVEDMVRLEAGMSKNEVLELMPDSPLYVNSGDSKTSVWVYEWRVIEVKSEIKMVGTETVIIPRKIDDNKKHQRSTGNLFLTFDINDKLLAWGPGPYVYPPLQTALEPTPNNDPDTGSFKLELKVEGTEDGTLTIQGGQ